MCFNQNQDIKIFVIAAPDKIQFFLCRTTREKSRAVPQGTRYLSHNLCRVVLEQKVAYLINIQTPNLHSSREDLGLKVLIHRPTPVSHASSQVQGRHAKCMESPYVTVNIPKVWAVNGIECFVLV